MVKKTIAFIGFNKEVEHMITNVVKQGCPVLITEKNHSNELSIFKNTILQEYPLAKFDVFECSKDCAWESDLLVLSVDIEDLKSLSVQIHNVVTGKIIITVQDLNYYETVKNKFAHAKVVWLNNKEVFSEDLSAVQKVQDFIL